jgi:hypothetical protein
VAAEVVEVEAAEPAEVPAAPEEGRAALVERAVPVEGGAAAELPAAEEE